MKESNLIANLQTLETFRTNGALLDAVLKMINTIGSPTKLGFMRERLIYDTTSNLGTRPGAGTLKSNSR